jgi:hypothetical protein
MNPVFESYHTRGRAFVGQKVLPPVYTKSEDVADLIYLGLQWELFNVTKH